MAAREAWGKYVTLKAKEHVRILGIVIGSVVFAAALLNGETERSIRRLCALTADGFLMFKQL